MGTLFNQRPRQDKLDDNRIISIGKSVKHIAKELDVSFDEALNLYLTVAKIDDYDVKDELITGFATWLNEWVQEIYEYKQQINSDFTDEKAELLKESAEMLRWLRENLNSFFK